MRNAINLIIFVMSIIWIATLSLCINGNLNPLLSAIAAFGVVLIFLVTGRIFSSAFRAIHNNIHIIKTDCDKENCVEKMSKIGAMKISVFGPLLLLPIIIGFFIMVFAAFIKNLYD